jgi:hypothetical protein
MVSIQLLGTAWTVWKLASKRVGPVGGLIATAVVIGGLVYVTPRLAEKSPALASVLTDANRENLSPSE